MKRILITVTLFFGAALAFGQDITGDWQGTLAAGGTELRLVLHITKASDGSMHGTLDSIDQNAIGIPVSSISLKDSQLSLVFSTPGANYDGKVAADGKTISGTWTQGASLPLDFKRATTPIKTEHKPAKSSDIDGAWLGSTNFGVKRH